MISTFHCRWIFFWPVLWEEWSKANKVRPVRPKNFLEPTEKNRFQWSVLISYGQIWSKLIPLWEGIFTRWFPKFEGSFSSLEKNHEKSITDISHSGYLEHHTFHFNFHSSELLMRKANLSPKFFSCITLCKFLCFSAIKDVAKWQWFFYGLYGNHYICFWPQNK